MKELLFRHCEKGVLALVLLLVGHGVYSRFAGEGEGGGAQRQVRPAAPPKVTLAIPPALYGSASPFIIVPKAARAKHNWFYPPTIHVCEAVALQFTKMETARVNVPARIVGTPVAVPLTEGEPKELGDLGKRNPTDPCEVDMSVDPKDPDVLVLNAKTAGNWRAYLVTLENEDKARIRVAVLLKDIHVVRRLAVAQNIRIAEKPLGTVVLQFTVPEETESADASTQTTLVQPTYLVIHRKGERDTEWRAVGRVEGRRPKTDEGGPKPPPRPAPRAEPESVGFPGGAPKPLAPAPPRPPRGEGPAPAAAPDEFVFLDNTVESETEYTYRIESVLVPTEGVKPLDPEMSEEKIYKTIAKFSFAYVGGGATRAKIVVFIGERDKPQATKAFQVDIGGRVGDLPKEAAGGAPPAAGTGGEAPAAAEDEGAFITRYLLVNIEQSVLHVVPQIIRVPDGKDINGRIKFKNVTAYQERFDHRIILRDRKNQLQQFWIERGFKGLGGE